MRKPKRFGDLWCRAVLRCARLHSKDKYEFDVADAWVDGFVTAAKKAEKQLAALKARLDAYVQNAAWCRGILCKEIELCVDDRTCSTLRAVAESLSPENPKLKGGE